MFSIVLPTYNEKDNLPKIISQIRDVLLSERLEGEIIIVDDNSPDGTSKIASVLKEKYKDLLIHIINRPNKSGIGPAYIAGFKEALKHNPDYIFEMDADLSHDPSYIPDFIQAMPKSDLVLGSRYTKSGRILNWGLLRRGVSRFGNSYARLILRLPFKDLTSGYKCFSRKVLESINLSDVESIGYCFQIELTYRAWLKNFRITEIPITFTERTVGHSKFSLRIVWETFIKVLKIKKSSRKVRDAQS